MKCLELSREVRTSENHRARLFTSNVTHQVTHLTAELNIATLQKENQNTQYDSGYWLRQVV